MKREPLLLLSVAIVWSVLAATYAWVPGLGMPGYVRVWGAGAMVFLILAATLMVKTKRRTRP